MEKNTTHRKETIILLLADMRNHRLIEGLQSVGLNTEKFYTNFTDLVLEKMGFEDYADRELSAWYEEMMLQSIHKELHYYIFHERQLAEKLYDLIELKREKMYADKTPPSSLRVVWGGLFKKWMTGQ
jgi:hypothetical protein